MTRLHEEYRSRIIPELKASLGKSNIHAVPRLQKIVVSMGVGEAVNDRKRLDQAVDQLTQLAGQKAQITRARKSVSGFRCEKVSRSVAELRCEARECMISLTG
jgi:large subunit ribosomal protein L5